MQLKSRLLTLLLDGADAERVQAFARDIGYLLALEPAARRLCLEALPRARSARTTSAFKQIVEGLSASLPDVPRNRIELMIRAANFLVDGLLSENVPKGDESLWVDDLISELRWIDESQRTDFGDLLGTLKQLAPRIEAEEREERTREGILPTFKSLGITVELRAIGRDHYRWGTPVDAYAPQILGVVGLFSIHIGLDAGNPKDIYFQADETSINNMVASLQAARKDLAALRVHLNVDQVGGLR